MAGQLCMPRYAFVRDKGLILMVLNTTFGSKHLEERASATSDLKNLQSLANSLGCTMKQIENENKEEVESFIDGIVRRIQNGDLQCEWLMFVVSTHGGIRLNRRINSNDHALMLKDSTLTGDNVIFTRDLVAKFDDTNCPILKDKPKLFFIQACRGLGRDDGVVVTEDGKPVEQGKADKRTEPVAQECPEISMDKDMLVMFASVHGQTALRLGDYGSMMLQILYSVLTEALENRTGLLELLTTVNGYMAKAEVETGEKTIGIIQHKLLKNLIF